MKKELHTKRLNFRQLMNTDKNEFFEIVGDRGVMKFWIGGADNNTEESEKRIIKINDHWKKHGFGDWGIFEQQTNKLIGFGGLHFIQNMDNVNIGYAFKKSEWRKGFAYESCLFFVNYAFNSLNLIKIVAVIWPQNEASIYLVKKCGFQFQEEIIWSGSVRVIYKKMNKNI
jgi:[ribosomal protein S5]-alanine N-acetyltransferase